MEEFYRPDTQFQIEHHTGNFIHTDQHFHSLHEIYYLTQGSNTFFINGLTYSAKRGDVIVIPPGTIHTSIRCSSDYRERLLIYLDSSYLKDFCDRTPADWSDVFVFHINAQSRIHSLFWSLLEEYRQEHDTVLMKAMLCELIILMQREKDQNRRLIHNTAASQQTLRIVEYINRHYASHLTLTQVAAHFYVSSGHLSRFFKENIGLTFSEYLCKYRISRSVELLQQTDKKITEIAYDTGFGSANHFCKTFTKTMGISPLKYRKACLLRKEK